MTVFMLIFVGCMEVVEDDNDQKELDLEFVKQNVILSADERTAYVNVGNFGIYIIDISDTKKPKLLKRYKSDASVRAIALNGDILYSANDDLGIDILDISDPAKISVAGSINIKDARTRSLNFNEDFSKLAVGTNKGVLLFEMISSSSLKFAGRYEMNASIFDAKFLDNSNALIIANFRYGVEILDIEKFSYPRLISSVPLEGNSCDIELDKNLPTAYVATLTSALKIIDISDIKYPNIEDRYDAHDVSMIWDIAIGNDPLKKRLYIAKSTRGFEIVDFTNPHDRKRVSRFDTNGTVRGVAVNKAQNRIFVADGKEGFKIFDISDKRSPKKIGYIPWK